MSTHPPDPTIEGGSGVGVLGVLTLPETLLALLPTTYQPTHLSPLGTQSNVPTHVQNWTYT